MDILNQLMDPAGHDQQVAKRAGAWIPVGMDGASWYKHACSSLGLDFLISNPHAQDTLKDIPGLIIGVVHMRWRNEPRRSAEVSPFCDHKIALRCPKDAAGQR